MSLRRYLAGKGAQGPEDGVRALIHAALVGEGRPARPHLGEALAVLTGTSWPWRPVPGAEITLTDGELTLGPPPQFVEVEGRRVRRAPDASAVLRAPLVLTDPREAWEAFGTRGLIPEAWVGSSARWFVPRAAGDFHYVAPPLPGDQGPVVRGVSGSRQEWLGRFQEPPAPLDPVTISFETHLGQWRPGFVHDPPSLDLAVALAADAEHVLRAEALVEELVARLAPWFDDEEQMRPVR